MTGWGRQSARAAAAGGLLVAAIAGFALSAPAPVPRHGAGASASTTVPDARAPEIVAPPSTTAPTEDAAGGVPVHVRIPELSVRSQVVPVGVDASNNVVVPDDIQDIGWYQYASDPMDQRGSTVLVGHRDGVDSGRGAFYALDDLVKGDRVTVRTSDGSRHDYTVLESRSISKGRFAEWAPEIFGTTGPRRLTLITCGGDYVRSAGGYQENVVVTAVPAAATQGLM